MKAEQSVQPDAAIKGIHGGGIGLRTAEIVAGRKDVTEVETDPQSLPAIGRMIQHPGQLLKAVAQVAALTGHRLQAERHPLGVQLVKEPAQRRNDPGEARLLPGPGVGTGVEGEGGKSQGDRPFHLDLERLIRSLPKRFFWRGDVDQVGAVTGNRPQYRMRVSLFFPQRQVLIADRPGLPLAVVLAKEHQGVAAHLLGARKDLVQTAGRRYHCA